MMKIKALQILAISLICFLVSVAQSKACETALESDLESLRNDLTVISVKESKRRGGRSKVFALEDGTVVYNATKFSDFEMELLPKNRVPIFRTNRDFLKIEPNNRLVRVILLPGVGGDISHSGTLLKVGRVFHEFSKRTQSKNPVVRYFAENHPRLIRPIEVVAFDMPGAGWGPSFDKLETASDIATYIRNVVNEIGQKDKVPTYIVGRSASSPLILLSATRPMKNVRGLIPTAGTFPSEIVLKENIEDVRKFEERGDAKINWDHVMGILNRINDPEASRILLKIGRNHSSSFWRFVTGADISIFALSGTEDAQTSSTARELWTRLLGNGEPIIQDIIISMMDHRPFTGHIEIPGANHFVFDRPERNLQEVLPHHSDVIAWKHVLTLFEMHYPKRRVEWFPSHL